MLLPGLPHDTDAFGHMNKARYLQIMDVPYIDEDGMGVAEALTAERLWRRMALQVGTPISEDRAGAVILAEVIDTSRTAETCRAVQEITTHHHSSEVQVLVAGPAAVSGLLSYQIGNGR